ncbi:unnamed protein product, partial [Symbiodinium sp. KB8]
MSSATWAPVPTGECAEKGVLAKRSVHMRSGPRSKILRALPALKPETKRIARIPHVATSADPDQEMPVMRLLEAILWPWRANEEWRKARDLESLAGGTALGVW